MISCVIVFITLSVSVIEARPDYVVSIVEIEWNVTTTHNADMEWRINRISRGVDAVSGFVVLKEDINSDNGICSFTVRYSSNGVSYALSPFRYPPNVLTEALNTAYKNYLMATFVECCENPIAFEEKFVQPITKRRMTCTNCMLNIENFPSHTRMGYYEVLLSLQGELEATVRLLLKAEKE